MIDFQAAERKRLEEPASEIGLEPLCAMVCESSTFIMDRFVQLLLLIYFYIDKRRIY